MKRVLINDVNAVDQVIISLINKEIIVYPTDTIYGIGTDANNDSGIQKINGLKQRTGPMTIIIHKLEDISSNIVINPILEEQMLKIVHNGDTCIVPFTENFISSLSALPGLRSPILWIASLQYPQLNLPASTIFPVRDWLPNLLLEQKPTSLTARDCSIGSFI